MVSPGWPAMLHTYTFTAGLARSASTIPSIRRLGRIDVYSDPGPTMINSAARIAVSASGLISASAGSRKTRSMCSAPYGTFDSPTRTSLPAVAQRTTSRSVDGTIWPRTARTRPDSRMACSKSPVISAIAVMKRFPNECPDECAFAAEAVLEQLGHQGLRLGERCEALADVAGWEHSILLAQPAARAAVVGDGDDRHDVAGVLLDASEQRREPGAATDRDQAGALGKRAGTCTAARQGRGRCCLALGGTAQGSSGRACRSEHDEPDADEREEERADRGGAGTAA